MALTLLAYCEALHYACVSVEKWDMNKYQDIFPRAYRCYLLVDTPEKVKRFLIGRQFFTIFVVFLIAQLTSFPGIPPDFAGMPPILVTILVQTGLPGIAITLTFGQLISQIYVEEFTLQFLNLYGCQLVIRMSLFVESTGVCNFSWLLYHLASKFFCKYLCGAGKNIPQSQADNDTATLEAPGSPTARIRGPDYVPVAYSDKPLSWWDYVKYTWSTCAILFSLFVILYGIGIRAYVLPVNVGGAYIIFFMVMTMLFYLEGMMIAIVATQYWDRETFSDSYRRAYILHEVINRPDNVKRFIIGRQFCTVLTNFLLAQIT